MQIAISVFGRFHAFYLARQLHKRNALAQLLTSHPAFEVVHYGLPRRKLSAFPWLEGLRQVSAKWPAAARFLWNPERRCHWAFDRVAASSLRPTADTFVGWSGSSLSTLKKAKTYGMVGIIESESSHCLHQLRIMKEEHDRFNLPFIDADPDAIDYATEEYRHADFISVPSLYARRSFIAQGIAENRLIQSTYGVNLTEFRPQVRHDKKFRVLFCGSLNLAKGVLYLVDAFSQLKLKDAELWLVGPLSSQVTSLLSSRFGNNPSIVYHGPRPRRSLAYYYSQASLLCSPSVDDGFALSIPEAMACGLPVVSSVNSAAADLIRDGVEGFLVPIRDVDALKEKILWAYEHPDRCYAMGQAAKERIRSGFTWDDYGQRIYLEYCKVLGASHERDSISVPA